MHKVNQCSQTLGLDEIYLSRYDMTSQNINPFKQCPIHVGVADSHKAYIIRYKQNQIVPCCHSNSISKNQL